jgi:Fe-S-cluster containining protein
MEEKRIREIRNHRLSHIGPLKIDPVVFEAKFVHGCSMSNCNATCCQDGVMVDLKERDTISRHADLIKQHMESDQEHDDSKWFDPNDEADEDFPSGRAIGTQSNEQGCVFLMKNGRCVLQFVASEEGISKHTLKPFYCFAFPVTIEKGVLTIDDPDFTDRPECCSMIPGGSRSVLEVCAEEFEFVLGKEGMDELRGIARTKG